MRAQRLVEARTWLELYSGHHDQDDAIATNAMLLATLLAQSREYEKAEKCFAVVSTVNPHHTIVAECNYRRALAGYLAGDMPAAYRYAMSALRPGEDIVYARARSLLAWIAMAKGDYVTAYAQFCGALEALDQCRAGDVHLRASLVYALAILAAEAQLGDPPAIDAEIAKTAWTASLVYPRVQAVRHCGFAYEAIGDYRTAMHRFMTAATIAAGTVWSIHGYTACATLSLRLGQREAAEAFAMNAIAVAERITETTGWDAILDEQRLSLLELAHVLARLGRGVEAEQYHGLYYESTELSVMSALHHDTRLATQKLQVKAMVRYALGEKQEAKRMLREARDEWLRIKYLRRGTDAANDLASIEAAVPDQLTAPTGSVIMPNVSMRDQSILQLVLAGLDNTDIANQLNISPKTVKNRISAIYKAFGVHNRAKLVLLFLGRDVVERPARIECG